MPGVGDNAGLLPVLAEVELWVVVPLQALSRKKANNRMHSDAILRRVWNERGVCLEV